MRRWFGIPIKVLECFISLKLKNNAAALRLFFVVELATLLYIRYILDTLTWDLIRESFWVCLVRAAINSEINDCVGPPGSYALCNMVRSKVQKISRIICPVVLATRSRLKQ